MVLDTALVGVTYRANRPKEQQEKQKHACRHFFERSVGEAWPILKTEVKTYGDSLELQ